MLKQWESNHRVIGENEVMEKTDLRTFGNAFSYEEAERPMGFPWDIPWDIPWDVDFPWGVP